MLCSGDNYHIETSQLLSDADHVEQDLSDKLQPSESTYNVHSPRFPLQTLIEVFADCNPHCIVFESSIRTTE